MTPCRDCRREVSEQAVFCPGCGAPHPAKPAWSGYGFEWKSRLAIGGLPFVHVSFKYRPDRRPVVARGIVAIGQFAVGVVTISQFGLGLVSVSQFTVAGFALAQFALAWSLVAQMGVYVAEGHGQLVRSVAQLLRMWS